MCAAGAATLTGYVGFLGKIKKILETVCHNCGKILVDEVSLTLRGGWRVLSSDLR